MDPDHPIPDSYWAVPGRLLAGEYPAHPDETKARNKLRALLDAGVEAFVDLTEEGEYRLRPYAGLLAEEAAALGRTAEHLRLSIPDMDVPRPEHAARILAAIDERIDAGRIVYVHCFGGIGRTGTIVGCALVERGRSADEAIAEIARLREDTPDGGIPSPETDLQRGFVRDWERRARGRRA
jgi:protein-tyrosine phosphatase